MNGASPAGLERAVPVERSDENNLSNFNADAEICAGLRNRFEKFEALVTLAERKFADGETGAAVAVCEIAAHLAFPVHAGLFAAPRLEKLLSSIGASISTPPPMAAPTSARRQVLHVLSYARLMGGDGRFVLRWIEADPDSTHSIAITSHWETAESMPAAFAAAAEHSGGRAYDLSSASTDPLTRAKRLRELAANSAVVALHLYPFDIIPSLALSYPAQPARVLFIHHSDHTFWLGRNVMDTLVHLRKPDLQLLSNRRGLPVEISTVLPIPLQIPVRRDAREVAKSRLGIAPETLLLVTIASPFKYEPFSGQGFRELVRPVIQAHSNCRLIVVGPKQSSEWQGLSDDTHGRVQALGPRWNNQDLLDAADIYLDSYPFASCTSILEAGSNGLPILSCNHPHPELAMLGAGAPGLELGMLLADGVAHYRELLARLITDPAYRTECGQRARAQIVGLHTGPRWAEAVQSLYVQSANTEKSGLEQDTRFGTGALDVALVKLFRHNDKAMLFTAGKHSAHLPWGTRVRTLLQLRSRGIPVRLPDFAPAPVRELVRGLKRLLQRPRTVGP